MLLRRRRAEHHQPTPILIPGSEARANYDMAKLEIDLPDYMVGKRQKDTRCNGGVPYVLYYWQPWKELRSVGFQSMPLGRDLTKAIAAAQRLNDRVAAGSERCRLAQISSRESMYRRLAALKAMR
jgi:hypothetical protein